MAPDPSTGGRVRPQHQAPAAATHWDRENLLEVLRGPGDMHVAVLKNEHGDIYFHAEWPYDLPQAWNERTIIAADHDSAVLCSA